MIVRALAANVREAMTDTPVVLINGARQTGKSTLARSIAGERGVSNYYTFDDQVALKAALDDPEGFLSGLMRPVVLDEVQRTPDLFVAIKAAVDRDRKPGSFLLTGSADILLLPRLSDSLAGRMEIITLWPLSQSEIEGAALATQAPSIIDALFDGPVPAFANPAPHREAVIQRILRGGYPTLLGRPADARRNAWFDSYITTIVQRDVRDMADIDGLTEMPRLLATLAANASSLLNFAGLSRDLGIPQTTLRRYLTILQTTFLVQLLPAWSTNLTSRIVKAPKLVLGDTGLIAYLTGMNASGLGGALPIGSLVENFAVMELRKLAAWSRTRPKLFHFRLHTGPEVDIVLEDRAGNIVGVEVKASASVDGSDFKGLRILAEAAGRRFRRGVVLYTGGQTVPFAANLHALPMEALWSAPPSAGKPVSVSKPKRAASADRARK